ncbi:MAG: hypothetical protein H0V95_14460, partial [Actinobacteria bacterium]|nr:hypothetical protein [Actinomycetota bacterium]
MTSVTDRTTRPRRSRRWGARLAVGLLAGVMATIAGVPSASADVTSVGGGAFGEQVNLSILGVGLVSSGPSPSVTLPSTGGGPFTNSLASVSVPPALTTGLLEVSTEGGSLGTHQGFATSSATIANAHIFTDFLLATAVNSTCTSNGDGSTGSSTLVGATLLGTPIPVNPAPNTTLNPVPGVTVILNEQIVVNDPGVETSITVNAVHIIVNLPGLASGDIILSQSRCAAFGPDVLGGPAPG